MEGKRGVNMNRNLIQLMNPSVGGYQADISVEGGVSNLETPPMFVVMLLCELFLLIVPWGESDVA